MNCVICKKKGERHHIKTVGSGGPNDDFNILYFCRAHHIEWHKIGLSNFFNKYSTVWTIVEAKGWYWLNHRLFNNKLIAK